MAKRDSRQLLLDAARQEFGEYGYAGARVARIARRAGVNKQLIFYYFRSKEGLHQAATVTAPDAPGPAPTPGPATEGVRRGFTTLFEALRRRPDLVATLVQPPGAAAAGATGNDLGAALTSLEAHLTVPVSAGQGLGYFRDDVDPGLIARQGLVLATGFLAMRSRLRDTDRDRWVREAGEMLVRMLAW